MRCIMHENKVKWIGYERLEVVEWLSVADEACTGSPGWAEIDIVRLQLGHHDCSLSSAYCSYGGPGFQFGQLYQ